MERLTERSSFSDLVLVRGRGLGRAYFAEDRDYKDYCDALNRLAAYEDTGLEPEEIIGRLAKQKVEDFFTDETKKALDKLMEYKTAEKEGRLLVLPCKVGDTVYTAQRGVISELFVEHFELYNVGIWVSWHLMSGLYGNFRMDGFPASDIGKTVFLTRAAAEAALGKERDV